MPDWKAARRHGWLIAVVALYCLLFLRNPLLPGLYSDEAGDAMMASKIIEHAAHPSLWPLGIREYHAALESYLLVPFIVAIKAPFAALRTAELLFAVLILVSTYFCAAEFFDPATASLAVLFLTLNPAFFYFSKLGIPMGSVTSAMSMGALWAAGRWWKGGRDRHLFFALILLGMGMSVRSWFVWFVLGLGAAALLAREELSARLRGRGRRFYLSAFLSLCGGAIVLIVKEIRGWGDPSKGFFASFPLHFPRTGMADNTQYLSNLSERLAEFRDLLAGRLTDICLSDWIAPAHAGFWSSWHLGFFLACLAVALAAAWRARSRKALAWPVMLAVMLLFSPFTLSKFRQDHLFLLFPLPEVIMAAGVLAVIRAGLAAPGAARKALGFAAVSAAIVTLVGHASLLGATERRFERTGGSSTCSEAIQDVTDWLLARGALQPNVCDWGPHAPIDWLSGGRIAVRSCFDGCLEHCPEGGVYVFMAHEYSPSLDQFSADLGRRRIRPTEKKVFYRRDRQIAFLAYVLPPRGGAGPR